MVNGLAELCLIVLIPGAFGGAASPAGWAIRADEYFARYEKVFRTEGCEVARVGFVPDATLEERGLMLKDQLTKLAREKPGRAVHLVAHSQGGLDARFALKTLELAGVKSLITIGTPHRGSEVARWAMEHRERRSWLYWGLRTLRNYDLDALRFLGELTPAFLARHGDGALAKAKGVRYASARGVCRTGCHWALRGVSRWVGLGPGDGLVEGESQRMGHDLGEFDLDHLSEVSMDPTKESEQIRLLKTMLDWIRSP